MAHFPFLATFRICLAWRMTAYIYTHDSTTGTTGYFACEPAAQEDLDQTLRKLAARPLDKFLHRHVLRRVLKLSARDLAELCQRELAGREPRRGIVAALLLEAAILDPRLAASMPAREELEAAAMPIFAHTPLPLARLSGKGTLAENRRVARLFGENIERHRPPEQGSKQEDRHNWELKRQLWTDGGKLLSSERERLLRSDNLERKRPPLKETVTRAAAVLEKSGLLAGPEMRHEASLSPIALLRDWRVSLSVEIGNARHTLDGKATAYGRGLSLAAARASCLMEIVERASAYVSVEPGGKYGDGKISGRARGGDLLKKSIRQMRASALSVIFPQASLDTAEMEDIPIYWLEAENSTGSVVFAPAQAVFLFCNLDEPSFFECGGSTGLAAGNSRVEARLSGLVEVLERYAHASMPFDPRQCFLPASRDPLLRDLLADYHFRGIYPQMQDITTELGLPAYRCFVMGKDGSVAQATGAGFNGKTAVLSALTETPWPYSWARPAPYGRPSALPGRLPVRFLEDLPAFDMPSPETGLLLLEKVLAARELSPVYADISRVDLEFPVARVFVSGLEINADFDETNPPGPMLRARGAAMGFS